MRFDSLCKCMLQFLLVNIYVVLLVLLVNRMCKDDGSKTPSQTDIKLITIEKELSVLDSEVKKIPPSVYKLYNKLEQQYSSDKTQQEDIYNLQKKLEKEMQIRVELNKDTENSADNYEVNLDSNKMVTPLCDDPTPGSKNIISYSLFGEKALHIGRFIKDVSEEALSIDPYKDFTLRIHVDKSFPKKNRDEYREKYSNVRFCDVTRIPVYGDISNAIGTVWRFIPMADTSIDVFCSRDLDSPLLQRGGDAVKEFLNSNATLHLMRDRWQHSIPIMGGMWCYRPNRDPSLSHQLISKILTRARKTSRTVADQYALRNFVWPALKLNSLQHDAYNCKRYTGSKPFPTQRREYYVGCVRNCNVYKKEPCPVECRPADHKEWEYC